jgi:hypothetical protein
MKKNHLFFLLILVSFFACKSKENVSPIAVEVQTPVVFKEDVGPRTLSWLSPYVGKTLVTFEDSLGNKQVFDISKSATSREVYTFNNKNIDGESFALFLTNRQDANQIFAFKPIGKNLVWFGNTLSISQESSYLRLQFGPYFSEEAYGIGLSSGLNKATFDYLKYTYSLNYPKEGDDSFIFNVEAGVKIFFASISVTQSKGIDYYLDNKGTKWKQISIQ